MIFVFNIAKDSGKGNSACAFCRENQNGNKMKPSEIKLSLELLASIGQPVFIWGAPGVGKSQVVAQTAEKLGLDLIDIRAVLLDPVDLRGLPRIEGELSHWSPPAFLPREGKGILFLDELNAAPPLVQAACYQLVLDGRLGEYELPEGWCVVAAGNRESDRAVTHRMPSALANRFVHLDFQVDLEDWLDWAAESNVPSEVMAFLRFRPNLLHDFDPSKSEKSFPSPRSWEFAAGIIGSKPDPTLEYSLICGAVGEGAAAEFAGFVRVFRDLPEPDAILMSPETAPIPKDPATLYALCEILARKAGEKTVERIMAYASRLPAEFSVLLVRDSMRNDKAIAKSPAFIRWATANSDVLF